MVAVCVVGLADTPKCADCIGRSVCHIIYNMCETYNMLIRNSHMQWVLLSAWYCSQLGYCLICWVW